MQWRFVLLYPIWQASRQNTRIELYKSIPSTISSKKQRDRLPCGDQATGIPPLLKLELLYCLQAAMQAGFIERSLVRVSGHLLRNAGVINTGLWLSAVKWKMENARPLKNWLQAPPFHINLRPIGFAKQRTHFKHSKAGNTGKLQGQVRRTFLILQGTWRPCVPQGIQKAGTNIRHVYAFTQHMQRCFQGTWVIPRRKRLTVMWTGCGNMALSSRAALVLCSVDAPSKVMFSLGGKFSVRWALWTRCPVCLSYVMLTASGSPMCRKSTSAGQWSSSVYIIATLRSPPVIALEELSLLSQPRHSSYLPHFC